MPYKNMETKYLNILLLISLLSLIGCSASNGKFSFNYLVNDFKYPFENTEINVGKLGNHSAFYIKDIQFDLENVDLDYTFDKKYRLKPGKALLLFFRMNNPGQFTVPGAGYTYYLYIKLNGLELNKSIVLNSKNTKLYYDAMPLRLEYKNINGYIILRDNVGEHLYGTIDIIGKNVKQYNSNYDIKAELNITGNFIISESKLFKQ